MRTIGLVVFGWLAVLGWWELVKGGGNWVTQLLTECERRRIKKDPNRRRFSVSIGGRDMGEYYAPSIDAALEMARAEAAGLGLDNQPASACGEGIPIPGAYNGVTGRIADWWAARG